MESTVFKQFDKPLSLIFAIPINCSAESRQRTASDALTISAQL